jgi:hypothetical protein
MVSARIGGGALIRPRAFVGCKRFVGRRLAGPLRWSVAPVAEKSSCVLLSLPPISSHNRLSCSFVS